MISIEQQLKLIKYFLDQPEFEGKAIINDNRMIPILSGVDFIIKDLNKLSSIEIYLPLVHGRKLGKWYPSKNSNLFLLYEKLSLAGLELDFEVIKNNLYNKVKKNIINYKGLSLSLYRTQNIRFVGDYHKIKDFNTDFKIIIVNYLSVIRSDSNDVISNIEMYYNKYIKYIYYKEKVLKIENIKYKKELIDHFFDYRIFEFKNRVKLYKTILNNGYKSLDNLYDLNFSAQKEINYYKNISVKNDNYYGKSYKIYNVESCKKMKKGNIMIAQDTNPEFIEAFYKASFICVETNSELSHASITCKELNIPLALGSTNIFLATSSGQKLNIDTKKQIIYLK